MRLEDKNYWKLLINMSLSKFLILRTLYKGSIHGYAILEKLREFTKGCCAPTYGTIYPILKELVKNGYASVNVETVNKRERKIYKLTSKGKKAYEAAFLVWQEVIPFLNKVIKEGCC